MSARESRPAVNGAATPNNAGQATPTVHQPDDFPALHGMTPRAQRIALAYYERGYQDGWGRGYDAAEAEAAAIQRAAHAVAQQAAKAPTFADLCDRRGQHARADRQRAILTERGIAR